MTDPTERPRCYRCLRPAAMCHCDRLPRVATRTRIEILQHPHERTHPFGTARLCKLCMPNARVHVPFAGFTGTLEHRLDVPTDAAVLYPHPDAPDLAELPPTQLPSTLIVIDGTWAHAKRLYRENAWLHDLPHVRLQPAEPSRYRIRKEPRPDYISTLEAIVEALRTIEPDTEGLDALLRAFDGMIDRQLAHRSDRRVHRFKVRRNKERNAVDERITDPRLVVVYAEARQRGTCDDPDRQLLHLVAARAADGATFEALLRPDDDGPSDEHLGHLQLTREQLAAGESHAAVRARLERFLGDAPIAAWTGSTFVWADPVLGTSNPRMQLKQQYCNVSQRRAGFLEDIVAREGLQPIANQLLGRAGARLANALAVARWLVQKGASG